MNDKRKMTGTEKELKKYLVSRLGYSEESASDEIVIMDLKGITLDWLESMKRTFGPIN